MLYLQDYMPSEQLHTITQDLTLQVGKLYQGNVVITQPSSPRLTNIANNTKDFYAKINDAQTSPFASLGTDVYPPINEKTEDQLSQQLLSEGKKKNNSPFFLFANLFGRAVELTLTDPNLIAIYDQGIIHIRHPLGFFALYCPPSDQTFENYLLIIPVTTFASSGTLDRSDTILYIYNPNATNYERLSAYLRKKVSKKNPNNSFYTDRPINPGFATDILRSVRNQMDNRGGLLSSVQTPLI